MGSWSGWLRGELSGSEAELTRHGLRLARLTIAYNVVEGAVAVSAGAAAGLVSLVGFGADSAIESVSAVLVAVRLSARLRHGTVDEVREKRALRLVAVSFFLLAGYVVAQGVADLVSREVPDTSTLGLVVLVASLVAMPLLAVAKRRVGLALGGDPLILADAAESRVCLLLSASTLAGLLLFQLTGAAWLDPVAGFVIAAVAVREGMEAWNGELGEVDDTE